MAKFLIKGGRPLYGSVRLGGAKNASYKIMIAALLGKGESRLLNFSHIDEVKISSEIVESLGGKVIPVGERTLSIKPDSLKMYKVPEEFGPRSRASSMFLPVLLHKFGKAQVPLPGGDKIGKRPLGWHFAGMEAMGAKFEKKNGSILAVAPKGLKAAKYKFPKNSHTGTETLIMAAVLARGKTVLENAALEPEVDDLIGFLNSMGGRIRRRHYRVIEIEGVKELRATIYKIMPDRNEAVSYACAAIATRGDIIVENAIREHLEAFLDKLEEVGGGYEVGNYGVRFYYKGALRATDIVTQPHPGFMTDWQPLWAVLLTQARGTSVIHEAVFPARFQYVDHLKQMKAKIQLFNPEVADPQKLYNFDLTEDEKENFHAVKITGPTKLKSGNFKVHDLRAGATLVLAALVAEGKSTIDNVELIDRGYEDLDGRLRSMGAKIERVD